MLGFSVGHADEDADSEVDCDADGRDGLESLLSFPAWHADKFDHDRDARGMGDSESSLSQSADDELSDEICCCT